QKQRFEDGWVSYQRALGGAEGDPRLCAAAWINAGFMPFWSGDDERASAAFDRGLELSRELGDQVLESRALGGVIRVALRSDVAEARRLGREAMHVGAAEAIMEAQGAAWPPDERPNYERMLAVLPDAMGAAEFERARAAGRSLPVSEAVTFALGSPATASAPT